MLTLATLEISLVAHVDVDEIQRYQTVERYFYAVVGCVWLLVHVLLFSFGNTKIFRSSWQSLAELEAWKEGTFEVMGGAKLRDGKWVHDAEQLFVGHDAKP